MGPRYAGPGHSLPDRAENGRFFMGFKRPRVRIPPARPVFFNPNLRAIRPRRASRHTVPGERAQISPRRMFQSQVSPSTRPAIVRSKGA